MISLLQLLSAPTVTDTACTPDVKFPCRPICCVHPLYDLCPPCVGAALLHNYVPCGLSASSASNAAAQLTFSYHIRTFALHNPINTPQPLPRNLFPLTMPISAFSSTKRCKLWHFAIVEPGEWRAWKKLRIQDPCVHQKTFQTCTPSHKIYK